MPFNDGSTQYYDEFLSVAGVMQGLVDKYYSCSFIFGGDFNISKSSSTSTHDFLTNFCDKYKMLWLNSVSNGMTTHIMKPLVIIH